ELGDLAFVDAARFDVGDDLLDALLGGIGGVAVDRGDDHGAVVGDVDGGAGFFGDGTDRGAALADHFADLVRMDLHGQQARGVFAHLGARGGDHLRHFAEDVQTAALGLFQRHAHDFFGDAVDLDVHLQGADAVRRAGHLEIHVAEVVFVTEDVGEDD